jgi:hypothetical protein
MTINLSELHVERIGTGDQQRAEVRCPDGESVGRLLLEAGSWKVGIPGDQDVLGEVPEFADALTMLFDELWRRAEEAEYTRQPWPRFEPETKPRRVKAVTA